MKFLLLILMPFMSQAKTQTVEFVDLNRYLGEWYEIASLPQSFSKGCHCTRAVYGIKENGDISVYNTCRKDSVQGKLSEAQGTAKVADKKSNAKLRVSFFWPFFGDYWVIGLDKDYRYAVVSNKTGSTFWILSRTPELAEDLQAEAFAIAKANGIDLSRVQMMEHQGCTYP